MDLKKCFAAILAAAIVCGNSASFTAGIKYAPDTVIAADDAAENAVWDGTADTSWYDDEENEFHITTAEQLAGIAGLANNGRKYFEDKTIILDSDIYLNRIGDEQREWQPISLFKGKFVGNGHCIFNCFSTTGGFFTELGGSLSDLKLINANIEKHEEHGSLLQGKYYSVKENTFLGGICDTSAGILKGCYFSGNIRGYSISFIGGLCGKTTDLIEDCIFSGNISALSSPNAGGICGISSNKLNRCSSSGKIIFPKCVYYNADTKLYGIGFIKDTDSGAILNCVNNMDFEVAASPEEAYNVSAYGIGHAKAKADVSDCYNTGSTLSDYSKAVSYGIAYLYNTMKGTENANHISNAYNVGIMEQYVASGYNTEISNVYYLNTITEAVNNTNIKAKTEANLKTEKFAEALGEAFEYVPDSYPRLVWETENEHLRLNRNSLTFTSLDTSEQLSLRESYDGNITWLSTDNSVASVDKKGVVVPHGNGNALIYAIYDNKKAVCDVKVEIPPFLDKTKMSINVGESEKLSVMSGSSSIDPEDLTFSSSDDKIAKVDKNGNVTGAAEGECTITVKTKDLTLTCEVTVTKKTEPPTDPDDNAELDNTSLTLSNGEVTTISVLNYEDSVEWISADPDVVTAEKKSKNTAKITATELGTTTVCAMLASGKTLICEVTVKAGKITTTTTNTTTTVTTTVTTTSVTTTKAPQAPLEINAEKITLKAGQHFTIKANQKKLTYSSSNTDVAIVSPDGIVTALKDGEATISVYNSSYDTASLRVIVSSNTWGDANCDEQVNMADAVLIMQSLSNPDKYALSLQGSINADVDGSNDITNKDALRIQQYKLGLLENII